MSDDPLDADTDPETLAVKARHDELTQDPLPLDDVAEARAALARAVERRAVLTDALKHGIDEAIEFTDDMEAAQIAEDLAEAGVDQLPHIHNWAPVVGTAMTIGRTQYCSYVCVCGGSKVDRAHG